MTVKQSLLFHRFVKTFQNAENIKETITEKISVTLIELRCVSCVSDSPLLRSQDVSGFTSAVSDPTYGD